MTEKKQLEKLENTRVQIYHHEIVIGKLIDSVEHMADRHQLKLAINKLAEVKNHLKFAITGIKVVKEKKDRKRNDNK